MLGVASLSGCSSLFGIDLPPLLHGAEAGAGDEANAAAGVAETSGSGDQATAGTSGSAESGTAGVANAGPVGGRGGDGAGRGASGGRGGSGGQSGRAGSSSGTRGGGGNVTHGGAGGESRGGSAGQGMAGSPSGGIVQPGTACTVAGAVACSADTVSDTTGVSTSWLLCERGTWKDGGDCPDAEVCDRRSGSCASYFSLECQVGKPGTQYCATADSGASEVVTCGLDLVSAEIDECTFGCQAGVGCAPPVGDEVVIEPVPPPSGPTRAYWPGGAVPVCVTNPERPEWVSVEDEIARTWGRFGGIAFTGWGNCDGGVVATLRTDVCESELGSVDRVGYPGPTGSVNLSLCTLYDDASGAESTTSDALLRLVARHEFGHVLGFADAADPNALGDVMARGIHTSELDQYPFTAADIGMLVEAYGRKPAGALVDERGDCLTFTNAALGFGLCDGSAPQAFEFTGGELVHPDTGTCLSSAPSAAATLAACVTGSPAAANQAWQPAEVEVRGFGGSCLQTQTSGSTPALTVDACPAFGTANALWAVESVDAGARVRIRQAGTTQCVTADLVDLGLSVDDCDNCPAVDAACDVVDRFSVTSAGQIRSGSYCFAEDAFGEPGDYETPHFGLSLTPCTLASSMLWNLSGRIESTAGAALTWSSDSAASPPSSAPIGSTSGSQIFDFYFSDSTP